MDWRHRKGFFLLIRVGVCLVTLAWGALLPAGGQDHPGHPPGMAHSHGHDRKGPASEINGAPPILFTPGQAEEITLRFARVEEHRIEKWIRTAGRSHPERQAPGSEPAPGSTRGPGRVLEGRVLGPEARLIQRGQQVRVFPLAGAHRMLQGKVAGLARKDAPENLAEAWVQVDFRDQWHREAHLYVMEIIVPLGMRLSIPHEAILEEAGKTLVFVREGKSVCRPRIISVGMRGELYDEVLGGLRAGEEVATFGSFFLGAELQLKGVSTRHPTGERP